MAPVPLASTEGACAERLPDAPAEAPATSLPDPLAPPHDGEQWVALYTRSRCEKRVARACEHLQIRHYLPLHEHRTAPGRAYRVPLFPSYVFACLTPHDRRLLLQAGAIARVIPVRQPEVLLVELQQIRAALASGADFAPAPALERGMRVRVIRGPLAGLEGLVAGRWFRRGRARLVLNVTTIGRGAAVTIDARAVEPVPASPAGMEVGPARGLDSGFEWRRGRHHHAAHV